jgi:hypothetical protein
MFLNKIFEDILVINPSSMLDFISLNPHQKKALVIELYNQGKTRRQIAETVLNGGLLSSHELQILV